MNFWKTTTIYGVGFIALRAISFLLLPLYTNLLSNTEAGWVFIIYTLLALLNVFYTHGMNAALLKFFHSSNKQEIVTTSTIYAIISSIALSLFLFTVYSIYAKTAGENHHLIVIFMLIIASLDMLSAKNNIILRLLERPLYYLFICLVNVLLSIGLNIYFIQICNQGIMGAIHSLLIVAIIQFLLLTPIMWSFIRITLFNYRLLLQMLTVGMSFFPAAVFFVFIELSDRWMLGYLLNIHEVGLYGAGYKIGSVVLLFVNSFNLNWQPYYLKTKLNKGMPVFEKIGTGFILILVFISTILASFWPILFNIKLGSYSLIGQDFWEGGRIIPIICISYIFYGIFILQIPSIFLKTKQKWAPIIWGSGLIINVLSNLVLIPVYGMFGAAYATLFAYITMSAIIIFKNYRWMRLKYNLQQIFSFIIISLGIYWISHAIIIYNNIWFIMGVVIVYSGIGAIYIIKAYKELKITAQ